jgi:hypothetical protein
MRKAASSLRAASLSSGRSIGRFSSSTKYHVPNAIISGAIPAISAAPCRAPAGDRFCTSRPPISAELIAATWNHSHCWFTNTPLVLYRWPFSTRSAPHSVLAIAIA